MYGPKLTPKTVEGALTPDHLISRTSIPNGNSPRALPSRRKCPHSTAVVAKFANSPLMLSTRSPLTGHAARREKRVIPLPAPANKTPGVHHDRAQCARTRGT